MKQYQLYNREPVIRTYSGLWMNVFNPTADMICIEDIAHHLSHLCRFGGATDRFYSVAQHSIHCAQLVNREHKLAALLHDASEAYLVDIPRPIKLKLTEYHPIENNLMRVIAEKYGFHYPLHNAVKQADEKMLQQEWDVFCIGSSKQWPSAKETRHVKSWFLTEFNLYAGINDKAGDRKAA